MLFTPLLALQLAVPTPADTGRSVAPLVERVKDAVVTIQSTKVIRRAVREDPFSQYLRERLGLGEGPPARRETQQGLGSGFIITKDGLVLTNNHVVAGADEVKVLLSDYRALDARVLGSDPATDVAVVQISRPPADLRVVAQGDSDKVRVGDYVLAIGNPLGLGQTVTMGIVSAKNRALGGRLVNYEDFIQTDAAINQGNSGGPLFNFNGEVIGINSAILNPAMAMNVGFAIPINLARSIAGQLRTGGGRVARGYLGVQTTDLTAEMARRTGTAPQPGALVNIVEADSPAERAGLRPNDVIIEVGGARVDGQTLLQAVASRRPGDTVKITFLRGGRRTEAAVKLTENIKLRGTQFLGISVEPVTPQERKELGVAGMRVVTVDARGPASGSIREGDVIVGVLLVSQRPIEATGEALKQLEQRVHKGGWGRLVILRDGYQIVVTVG